MQRILEAIQVIDLSNEIAGAYAARLFAQYGANVIKVEPPMGDPLRFHGPFSNDQPDPEASGLFLYLNGGKRGVTLDLETREGRQKLLALTDGADLLIESSTPGRMAALGLGPEELRARAPRLVVTSISPFGKDGPYRDYVATDLVAWAASGAMSNTGYAGQEPLAIGSSLSYFATGALAAVASLAALCRDDTRQAVDVSLLDGMIQLYGSSAINRGSQAGQPPRPLGRDPLGRPQRCKDGYVGINPLSPQHWPMFCAMARLVEIVDDPRFASSAARATNAAALEEIIAPWFLAHGTDEIFDMAALYSLPVGFVATAPEVLGMRQHAARQYFVEVEASPVVKLRLPGLPVRFKDVAVEELSRAPRLGEHNEAVFGELDKPHSPRPSGQPGSGGRARLPLDGVSVLDCTQWNSGPLATRLLSDLGADVVKVESVQHPDPLRLGVGGGAREGLPSDFHERSAEWIYVNRNKKDITLDLTTEAGVSVFLKLAAKADIIAENLRPGVWERFGLGYERLRELNPGLIFVKMPGYGTTGPWSDRACWAMAIDQMAGFASTTGYRPDAPLSHALWPDYANGMHLAFALIAALMRRARTGEGCFIDLSQLEVVTAMNPEPLLDYQMNGRVWEPGGNRSRHGMAPHGCFRCKGDDQWIAIAVENDDQWRALCKVAGNPEALTDPCFAAGPDRFQEQAALREAVDAWTNGEEKWQLMHRLQRAGVPAAAVASGREAAEDPHLWQRGSLERLDRAVVGEQTYVGVPFRYEKTPLRTRWPGPTLGEHNYEVLSGLGLSDEQIEELAQRHVIGTSPLDH